MKTDMLREFLNLVMTENKDVYFDYFLKALSAKIQNIQVSKIKLPKFLTLELNKFNFANTESDDKDLNLSNF